MTSNPVKCVNCSSLGRAGKDYVCRESKFPIAAAEVNDSMLCSCYREKRKVTKTVPSSPSFLTELGIAQPGDE